MSYSLEFSEPSGSRCPRYRPGPADVPFTSHEEHLPEVVNPWQRPGLDIPEIDTPSFLSHLLPPLKDEIILEDVLSYLKEEGVLDSAGSWTDGVTLWEENEFASLRNLFDKSVFIARSSYPVLEQTIDLMLPDASLASQSLPQRTSYLVLEEPEKCVAAKHSIDRDDISWFNVAVPMALRNCGSYDSPKYNTSKLISSVQTIMARDPSRRFLFGIKVDNKTVRLWFFSRGTPVVSKAFDMVTEIHLLIHAFLSIAFASKEELGWDLTVQSFVKSDGNRTYRIDVDGETYETKDMLANNSSHILVSQATRVWTVTRQGSEESLVLKDLWLEDDRELEHATYDTILRDVEEKYGVDIRKEVASHLLTPVAHCLVRINGVEDHTGRTMMRGYSLPVNSKFSIDVDNIATVKNVDREATSRFGVPIQDLEDCILSSPFPRRLPPDKTVHRRHYRIVYKEVALEVHSIRSLPDIVAVLSDSAAVLKWIHGCGWVHRDLSVGNLYLYRGRGLIGDLEYAKRRNFDVEHERRAGTPGFASVEASRRQFGYLPEKDFDYPKLGSLAWREGILENFAKMRKTQFSCPPFFHHDLHDLESLWWIAVWIFFTFCVASERETAERAYEEQESKRRSAHERLFSQDSSVGDRRLFLDNQRFFEQTLHWIPRHRFTIKKVLDALRGVLLQTYREFEAKFPAVDVSLFDEIHDVFCAIFAKCKELFCDATLVPYAELTQCDLNERQSPRRCHEPTEHAHAKNSPSECRLNRGPQEQEAGHGESASQRKRKRDEKDVNSPRPLCIQRRELEVF